MAATTTIDYLVGKGWTREQAAGVAANLQSESNFKVNAVGDSGKAYGIAQWHPPRQRAFAAWAGKDIKGSSLEEQLGFLHYELTEGDERKAGVKLKASATAEEAGSVVSRYYERPRDKEKESGKRSALAAQLFGKPSSGAPVPVTKKSARSVDEDGNVSNYTRPVVELYKGGEVALPETPQQAARPSGPGIAVLPGGDNGFNLDPYENRDAAHQAAKEAQPFMGSVFQIDSTLGASVATSLASTKRLVTGLMDGFPQADPEYASYYMENYDKIRAPYTDRERELLDDTTSPSDLGDTIWRIKQERERAVIIGQSSLGGQLGGAMLADFLNPVTWAAGLGTSAALGAVGKGAYGLAAAGRPVAALASSAVEGAVGNVLYDTALVAMGDQRTAADFGISAGMGAVVGTLLGSIAYRQGSLVQGEQRAQALAVAEAAAASKAGYVAKAAQELGEAATPEAVAKLAAKHEAADMLEAVRAQGTPNPRDAMPAALAPDEVKPTSDLAPTETPPAAAADGVPPVSPEERLSADARANGEDYIGASNDEGVAPVLDNSPDGVRARAMRDKYANTVPKDDSTIPTSKANRDLWDNGILLELNTVHDLLKYSRTTVQRMRRGGELPDLKAKAVYDAGDDKVYLIRSNMTKEEIANPHGLIAHEVGVHYGLERTVGYEKFRKIIDDLERSYNPEAQAARAAVPENTVPWLRGEEMLGYLAEQGTSTVAQKVIAAVRNFLRNNVRAFRNMEVSVQDALSYIRGAVKRARKGRVSKDAEFPYVWHGSAVKDIDKFDLSYAGSGEGFSSYGHGHYLTSERYTGLDYRAVASKRRGNEPESGGLYRMKLAGTREDYMDWDAAVGATVSSKVPEALPTMTGEQLYTKLTKEYGTQKAATQYLAAHGIKGHRFASGRTRKGNKVGNSNYVVYTDPDVSIDVRYSFGTDLMPQNTPAEVASKKRTEMIIEHSAEWVRNNPANPERLKTAGAYVGLETPGQVLAKEKHPVAQWFAANITEHTMGAHGRRSTAAIRQQQLHEEFVGNTNLEFNAAYNTWSNEKYGHTGSAVSNLMDLKAYTEFNTEIMAQVESRLMGHPITSHPMVVRASDTVEAMYTRMLHAQKQARTVGWAELPANSVGHLTHSLDAIKISDMPIEALQVYRKVIEDQLVQYSGFDRAFSERMSRAYLDHARINAHAGHEIPANTTDPSASGFVEQALMAAGFTDAEVAATLTRLAAGGASHTKKRFKFDLNEVHELPDGTKVRLMDLFKTDVMMLLSNQSRRVAGEVALAEKNIWGSAGLMEIRRAMMFGDPANGTKVSPAAMAAFDQVSAELLGRPFGDAMPRGLEALVTATAQAKLGMMGVTQAGETINMAVALGVGHAVNFVAAAPRLFKEVRALVKGKTVHNPVLSSIELMGGQGEFGTQGYKMHTAYSDPTSVHDTVGRSGAGPVTRLLRATGQSFKVASMHRIIEAVQRRGVAEQITIKALRALRDGGADLRLADMGFTPDVIARLRSDLPNAVLWNGNHVKEFDIRKFKDIDAAREFAVAIRRGSGQIIQEAFIGEIGFWQHKTLGKVLSQFRNYPLLAMEKQYGRTRAMYGGGIQGHAMAAAFIVAAAGAAIPLHLARVQFNAMGRTDREEYIDKMTTPGAMASAVLNYIAMSGMGQDFVNITRDGVDAANGESRSSKSSLGGVVPMVGYVESLMSLYKNLDDPRALQRVLPLGNTPLMSTLFNLWAD